MKTDEKPAVAAVAGGKPVIVTTVCLYLLMLTYAVSFTMVGPMMAVLIKHYSLSLSRGGLIATLQSLGGITAILLGGILADRLKKPMLIGIGFAFYTVALFAVSFMPAYGLLLAVFFLLGGSTKLVDTVTNAYIADLHPERRGTFVNLLHVFFGTGALIGPLYSRFLIAEGIEWNQGFRMLGVISIFILLIYIGLNRLVPLHMESGRSASAQSLSTVVTSPQMWILCLIVFMYGGHQSGINVWLPMYMETELRTSPFLSGISLSVFWSGIIIGRLLCSKLSQIYNVKHLLLWGNLLGGTILVGGMISGIPSVMIGTVGLAGFFTGATIPLLVVVACGLFPRKSGAASSLLFLNNSIAWILFPWLIGMLAEQMGFHSAMILTGTNLLAAFLAALLIPGKK